MTPILTIIHLDVATSIRDQSFIQVLRKSRNISDTSKKTYPHRMVGSTGYSTISHDILLQLAAPHSPNHCRIALCLLICLVPLVPMAGIIRQQKKNVPSRIIGSVPAESRGSQPRNHGFFDGFCHLMGVFFVQCSHDTSAGSYCGWLRYPAPPKGWLKHVETL